MQGVKHLVRYKEICLDPAEPSEFLVFVKPLLIFVNYIVFVLIFGPKNNISHFSFHLAVANQLIFKLPTITPKEPSSFMSLSLTTRGMLPAAHTAVKAQLCILCSLFL